MAEKIDREIRIKVSASDAASGTFAKIGQDAKKMAAEVASARGSGSYANHPEGFIGPVIDPFERQVRERMVGRERARRDAVERDRIDAEVMSRELSRNARDIRPGEFD